MIIQEPLFKEKRQFGRIKIPVPTQCFVCMSQLEELLAFPGIIKNISLGGLYFVCDDELPIEKGDSRELIFDFLYNDQKIYRLIINGFIARIKKKAGDQPGFGIAIKFLSDPMYYSLDEINYNGHPSTDRIRLMYQHYQLFRKVYEIIQNKQKDIAMSINENIH